MKDPWIVHPNRFEVTSTPRPDITDDAPFVPAGTERPDMNLPCVIVLPLPTRYARRRVATGEVVFAEDSWREIAGPALLLARSVDPDVPRFGIKLPGEAQWQWWDGTATDDHILERDNAAEYLQPWLERIYPDATAPIKVIDQRGRA